MPLRLRALLTLIVAIGLQVSPVCSDSPSNQSAMLNLTTLTIIDAISKAEAWQSSQQQSQCCVATADLCCPAGTACRPPGGCVALAAPEPVPMPVQAMGTEPEGFHSAAGAVPLGTMVVAVLAVSCACLCLLACCAKQLCGCMFDPGPDGEWSGGQMGMAGLAGAAAGYELERMMDGRPGYGGGYGGGFGGPAW